MDPFEARSISAGRAVTYLQYAYYGDHLAKANGWSLDIVNEMRRHPMFADTNNRAADLTYHRHQMVEGPGSVFPWEWMLDCSAIGSVDECVTSLQRFIDAGVDEVATYGSTPQQNAALAAAWSVRPQAPRAVASAAGARIG
jgi:hypothetical protein